MKLIIVRSGSAILYSEFGERPVSVGDVILLGANVLYGSEPEGHITTTTIYADTDYLLDQVFWQYNTERTRTCDLDADRASPLRTIDMCPPEQ